MINLVKSTLVPPHTPITKHTQFTGAGLLFHLILFLCLLIFFHTVNECKANTRRRRRRTGWEKKKKRKKQCEALCNYAWREDKKGKKSMTKRVTPNTGCCSVKQQKAHGYFRDLTLRSIDFAKAQLQMTRCSTRTTHHKAGSNVCY